MEAAPERAEYLRSVIDPEPGAELSPVYAQAWADEERLFLFDSTERRRGPAGEAVQLTSGCLIAAPKRLSEVSLKASPKLNPILESLGASATGSAAIALEGDPEFSAQVTLYTRDPEAAQRLLEADIKQNFLRLLTSYDMQPTLRLGERFLLFANRRPQEDPTPLETLEAALRDVRQLYMRLKRRGENASL